MSKLMATIEQRRGLSLLVAGGISATGFAPLNWWPLTLLCIALLMHLVAKAESGKRAFVLGWLFGVGHFCIGNNWIATAFTYQAAMPAWLGWIAVFLLALYLAVYPALACWGGWWMAQIPHRVRRGSRPEMTDGEGRVSISLILSFAGCWIVSEWLRSWVFTGFAWNPVSASFPAALNEPPLIRWIGTYGSSGIIVATAGAAILITASLLRSGPGWRSAFAPKLALFGMSVLFFTSGWVGAPDARDTQGASLTIVQPNISQIDKYKPGFDAINFSRLARHSQPKDGEPRLILWPEAAIPWRLEDGYPFRYYQFQPGETAQGARRMLMRLMNPGDVLLTGVDRLEFDEDQQLVGARNSVAAMDSSGNLIGTYDKAHLVPYGEYLALRWLFEPLGATRLVPGTIDFWPGPGPRTLDLAFQGSRLKAGMQICYEMIFSGQVIDRANRPDFIFNPSNDAWFGSWGPPQHLAQARLRAIEEGLPVVRSTPTGISAVIDADGRIVKYLASGKAGRIDARLPAAREPTLFARHGNILSLAFAVLLIAAAFIPLARRRTSR